MEDQALINLETMISQEYSNIAGIVVRKNDQLIYERYWNGCTKTSTLHIYSVTKSILSMLIGIAFDKGYLMDINQPVLDFFPEYTVKKKEKTIQHVTLSNMLTMTAPYTYKIGPYLKYFTSEDWVTFSLNLLGGKKAIGEFFYAPLIGLDILSGILMKVTHTSVREFAQEHLFSPLAITVKNSIYFQSKQEQLAFNKARDISGWAVDPKGVNAAGWGLTLSARNMAKLGQLYLNGGIWNGKQIISKAWIEESTKEHSRWDKMKLQYGYLWWLDVGEKNSFAAMGDGGNVIYVQPDKKIVISIMGFFKPNAKDSIDLIATHIRPLFDAIEI